MFITKQVANEIRVINKNREGLRAFPTKLIELTNIYRLIIRKQDLSPAKVE